MFLLAKRVEKVDNLSNISFPPMNNHNFVVLTNCPLRVTVNNNSPIQDYVLPDDQSQPTFEISRCCISFHS